MEDDVVAEGGETLCDTDKEVANDENTNMKGLILSLFLILLAIFL